MTRLSQAPRFKVQGSEFKVQSSQFKIRSSAILHPLPSTFALLALLALSLPVVARAADRPTLLLVIGPPGQSEYSTNFLQQASAWTKACALAGAEQITIGLSVPGPTNDMDLLKNALVTEGKNGPAPLWLVFVGHGTFDGKEA